MKYRDKFMAVASLIVLLALFASDPDIGFIQALPIGGSTLAWLLIFSKAIIALAFAHYGRKVLFDYPEGNFQNVAASALAGNIAAGLLAIAFAIVFHGLLGLFGKAG